MDGAVVFDVNLRAGFRDDAFDRLPAGPDEAADFLGIDFDRLDPGRVPAQIGARLVDRPRHDFENFRARFFRAHGRFGHDLVAHAGQFEIELETGDARFRSADFVIHIAEMIFGADDVGQELVAFHLPVITLLRDETNADPGDRGLDRNARIHQREHAAANARHRAGAV